jgi:sensor histidine kinase regulating citrate/malate metabolism
MISPEEIGNFFKRGYSTKQTQAGSGAASKRADSAAYGQADDRRGLGLYYLQTNITKAGGSVGADCVCYEGSCHMIFRLML